MTAIYLLQSETEEAPIDATVLLWPERESDNPSKVAALVGRELLKSVQDGKDFYLLTNAYYAYKIAETFARIYNLEGVEQFNVEGERRFGRIFNSLFNINCALALGGGHNEEELESLLNGQGDV